LRRDRDHLGPPFFLKKVATRGRRIAKSRGKLGGNVPIRLQGEGDCSSLLKDSFAKKKKKGRPEVEEVKKEEMRKGTKGGGRAFGREEGG